MLPAALSVLLGCAQVVTQPRMDTARAAVSREADAAKECLAECNGAGRDPSAFERFAARRYSRAELAERNASAIANSVRNWHHSFGAMRLIGTWSVTPGEAQGTVYLAGVDACAQLFVESHADEGGKIGGVYLSPFKAVECGGVVLITHRGRPLVAEARGLARTQPPVPNTLDTPFEIASIAKTFTSVAIARLVEQKRLSYETTVEEVLPEFPGRPEIRKITVGQLLSHTSGIPDYYRSGAILKDFRRRERLAEYWPLFASLPLAFEPGSQYSYSNSNFALLGSIVEAASGISFAAFVEQHVFQRAQMKASCYCDPRTEPFAQPRSTHTALAGPARTAVREGWIAVPYEWPRACAFRRLCSLERVGSRPFWRGVAGKALDGREHAGARAAAGRADAGWRPHGPRFHAL